MTHQQSQAALIEISIAYETEPSERTGKQYGLARYGLCNACARNQTGWIYISLLEGWGNDNLYWLPVLHGGWSSYTRDHTREHDFLRATFAGFMAALSKKDLEEMTR